VLASLLLGVGLALWAPFAPAEVTGPRSGEVHIVVPGESLWTIARSYYPDHDPREVVYRLERELTRAGSPASVIFPGQRIILP
jgi:nucleoid-associated protein YgaU